MTDTVSLLVVLSPWLIKLVWEVVILIQRLRKQPGWLTISMSMREHRFHVTSHIYIASGMLTHWYWPWRHATNLGTVAFWLIGAAVLVWDIAWRNKPLWAFPGWAMHAKDSRWWLIAGLLGGLLLFPQAPI